MEALCNRFAWRLIHTRKAGRNTDSCQPCIVGRQLTSPLPIPTEPLFTLLTSCPTFPTTCCIINPQQPLRSQHITKIPGGNFIHSPPLPRGRITTPQIPAFRPFLHLPSAPSSFPSPPPSTNPSPPPFRPLFPSPEKERKRERNRHNYLYPLPSPAASTNHTNN